jgi:hypothetical protein
MTAAERYRQQYAEWLDTLEKLREKRPSVTAREVTLVHTQALALRGERRVTLAELKDETLRADDSLRLCS